LRSDFGLGAFAPAVSDEVEVKISLEAAKAE
ncbi:MAG: YceI family protein, partial [Roseobacter sp.]